MVPPIVGGSSYQSHTNTRTHAHTHAQRFFQAILDLLKLTIEMNYYSQPGAPGLNEFQSSFFSLLGTSLPLGLLEGQSLLCLSA